jgi:asparagine synthetase B (glutamine-hydrolysing)
MCGVAGIYKINGPTEPEDMAAVRRMMDAQIHRGPDMAVAGQSLMRNHPEAV